MGKSETIELYQLKIEAGNIANNQVCIAAYIDKIITLFNIMKECQRSYKQASDILIQDSARKDFNFNDFFLEQIDSVTATVAGQAPNEDHFKQQLLLNGLINLQKQARDNLQVSGGGDPDELVIFGSF